MSRNGFSKAYRRRTVTSGLWSPSIITPSVPSFGGAIPAPFAEITGTEAAASTMSEFTAAYNAGYSRIRVTAMIQLTNGLFDGLNRSIYVYGSGTGTGFRGRVNIGGSNIRLRNLEVVGDQTTSPYYGGVYLDAPGTQTNVDLDGLYIHDVYTGQGILEQNQVVSSNVWVRNCKITRIRGVDGSGAGARGQIIYTGGSSSNWTITNNLLISHPYGDGLGGGFCIQFTSDLAGHYKRDMLVSGNTLVEANTNSDGRGGIAMRAEAERVTMVGNIIAYPRYGCVEAAAANVDDCVMFDTVYWNLPLFTSGYATLPNSNSLSANPLFVDRAGGDYRLLQTSPAKNHVAAGRYSLLPPTFRDGTPRTAATAGSERLA